MAIRETPYGGRKPNRNVWNQHVWKNQTGSCLKQTTNEIYFLLHVKKSRDDRIACFGKITFLSVGCNSVGIVQALNFGFDSEEIREARWRATSTISTAGVARSQTIWRARFSTTIDTGDDKPGFLVSVRTELLTALSKYLKTALRQIQNRIDTDITTN